MYHFVVELFEKYIENKLSDIATLQMSISCNKPKVIHMVKQSGIIIVIMYHWNCILRLIMSKKVGEGFSTKTFGFSLRLKVSV